MTAVWRKRLGATVLLGSIGTDLVRAVGAK
jgi:hypothetical protein